MLAGMSRLVFAALFAFVVAVAGPASAQGDESPAGRQPLEVYFIDVEGGGAMLVVSPSGVSMLVDSGYPDLGGRDLRRLLRVIKDVAKLEVLNLAVVTHWHRDHYGNHAALAAEIPIAAFADRGIPDALQEDAEFETRIGDYRRASQNESITLKARMVSDLDGTIVPVSEHVSFEIVAASRQVIDRSVRHPDQTMPNPYAEQHVPRDRDASDNAESLAMVIRCGEFDLFCGGDLTWNVEADLMTPNNPVGEVDVYMVTHHGLPTSNNPVLVKALDPTTAVMCNGPAKGGHPDVLALLRELTGNGDLKAWFQLHENLSVPLEQQTELSRIANRGPTESCEGRYVKVTYVPGSDEFTVAIEGREPETFAVK